MIRMRLAMVLVVTLVLAGTAGASAGSFAYITNYGSNTVSVIDTGANKVTVTVPVGNSPLGVAVSPDWSRIYVVNSGAPGFVSVIDAAQNVVTATVPVGNYPAGVAVSPDGSHVYVANSSDNTVSVIAAATNTVIATVGAGTAQFNYPYGVAVSPDGSRVYVTNSWGNTVSVITTVNNTVAGAIVVGNGPISVDVSADGSRVYVANLGGNTVSVITTATNPCLQTCANAVATVGGGNPSPFNMPFDVAVTPDGSHVYVANFGGNTVSVIATATNTVTATVPVGNFPAGVAVTPDGSHVYVANFGDSPGTVSVISTATNSVTATVPVGNIPVAFGGRFISGSKLVHFANFTAQGGIHGGSIHVRGTFTLGQGSTGINPITQAVTISVGPYTMDIPAGWFQMDRQGGYVYSGSINRVSVTVNIDPLGGSTYAIGVQGTHTGGTGNVSPVKVTVTIGNDTGETQLAP